MTGMVSGVFLVSGILTCVDGDLCLAGNSTGQVFGGAGVNTGILRTGIEHHHRVLGVIVHERAMAALGEEGVVLQPTNQSAVSD